jgi:glycosyltransferase involved in cell wall biosynthesis
MISNTKESLTERLLRGLVQKISWKKYSDTTEPLRVLHILSQQPGKTGSGVYLQAIVTQAFRSGIRQHVIAALPANGAMPELPPLDSKNISPVFFETRELPFPIPGMSDVMPYKSTRFSSFTPEMLELYLQAFSSVITHTIKKFQPHIIHTHHLWLVTALTRILNPDIPVVTTCHGTDLRQLILAPHLKPFVIPACSLIDRVFALHPFQVKQLFAEYHFPHERIDLIGAGYRNDIFCRDHRAQQRNRPANELRVVYAGKISRAKGVPWLINAIQDVTIPESHTIRLFLAGSFGSCEGENILSNIDESASQIKYMGPLSQKKLADLLKTADLFVLPSFYEGLPLVILEALACGCRIVVTDIPGLSSWLPEELVKNEIVKQIPLPRLTRVDEPNPEDLPSFQKHLTDAISFQLNQTTLPDVFQTEAIQSCIEDFRWESIFAKIEAIYKKLSGKAE